ncbi:MAG: hypothetical protein CMN71_13750 [Sphingomonadaceae bacterium]|nr:hypothetical protein [Sphingomonadaceae bacterium]|tara:strand:- start:646 stop:855 length:210 start_codon:yes stop_codon:yes gene_type:complete
MMALSLIGTSRFGTTALRMIFYRDLTACLKPSRRLNFKIDGLVLEWLLVLDFGHEEAGAGSTMSNDGSA